MKKLLLSFSLLASIPQSLYCMNVVEPNVLNQPDLTVAHVSFIDIHGNSCTIERKLILETGSLMLADLIEKSDNQPIALKGNDTIDQFKAVIANAIACKRSNDYTHIIDEYVSTIMIFKADRSDKGVNYIKAIIGLTNLIIQADYYGLSQLNKITSKALKRVISFANWKKYISSYISEEEYATVVITAFIVDMLLADRIITVTDEKGFVACIDLKQLDLLDCDKLKSYLSVTSLPANQDGVFMLPKSIDLVGIKTCIDITYQFITKEKTAEVLAQELRNSVSQNDLIYILKLAKIFNLTPVIHILNTIIVPSDVEQQIALLLGQLNT